MIVPSSAALAEVRRIFAERQASGAAPNLAFGVLAGGGLVDGEDVDTAYRVASCTKSFTAAALLQLRDRGLIDLDAPITDWVPKLRLIPGDRVPTLRMLLTMSAGLANDDPWADRQEAMTDDELDATCAGGVRLMWEPGTAFEYSNLGYALLGRVIQVAAGRPYHDVVTDELLRPLGLTSTAFTPPAGAAAVATGFERQGDEWVALPFSGPGAFSPLGGLFSTVHDLCRWMQWFAGADNGGDGGDGGDGDRHRDDGSGGHDVDDPLSPASRREMCRGTQAREAEGAADGVATYGFGLVELRHPRHGTLVYHSGGYPGFSAHMRWHPGSGLGIVALENATYAGVSGPAAAALDALLDATLAPPPIVPWPETLAAQDTVVALIRNGWDDRVADELFTTNVAEDRSYERRRAQLAELREQTGALGEVVEASSDTPANRAWTIRGELAGLRVDISLHPLDPPRVQWLDVELQPHQPDRPLAPPQPA
ncbi:MAG: serine hydrolase domain-containing protein [Ilumatobacteraceae bacterium]